MNIELKNYLQDGANWQARCVLCYLQGNIHEIDFLIKDELNLEKNETDIYVGRYENCREQGYVVSLCYKGRRINYAIYEHRNSDELIVLKSNCKTTNTPNAKEHIFIILKFLSFLNCSSYLKYASFKSFLLIINFIFLSFETVLPSFQTYSLLSFI
jgi:hypothetical protein